jgi:hypothetical protein
VGEAGPVEQSSVEARSLKTKAKGLSGYYSSEKIVKRGANGPNKRATVTTFLLKKRRAEKQLFA